MKSAQRRVFRWPFLGHWSAKEERLLFVQFHLAVRPVLRRTLSQECARQTEGSVEIFAPGAGSGASTYPRNHSGKCYQLSERAACAPELVCPVPLPWLGLRESVWNAKSPRVDTHCV